VPHVEQRVTVVPTVDHVTEMVERVDIVVDQVCKVNYVTEYVPVDVPVVTSHVRTCMVTVPTCYQPCLPFC
jgi:hypothetical protein